MQADGSGAFTTLITVPAAAPTGPNYIDAGDQTAFLTAQAPFSIVSQSTIQGPAQRIQQLERIIQENPSVFDWNVHNELRHLYSTTTPPNLRKAIEHSNIILQHSIMDDYILHILSGWQIDKDTSAARGNLLNTAQNYPHLRFVVAASLLKIGDLYTAEGNLEEAQSFYMKVAEDSSSDMTQRLIPLRQVSAS